MRRTLKAMSFMLSENETYRAAAKRVGVSYALLYKQVQSLLPYLDDDVREAFLKHVRQNRVEAQTRGGQAYRAKYKGKRRIYVSESNGHSSGESSQGGNGRP